MQSTCVFCRSMCLFKSSKVRLFAEFSRSCLLSSSSTLWLHCRLLTVSQTSTALRPFYFVVHPDFFGQHPTERSVNEESLKKLHEYVTSLHKTGKAKSTDLVFYTRKSQQNEDLNCVKIDLRSTDVRSAVTLILKSFCLPLDYIDKIPQVRPVYKTTAFPRPIKWDHTYYQFTGKTNPDHQNKEEKPQLTLLTWLHKNYKRAEQNELASQVIQNNVSNLCQKLRTEIGLTAIDWYTDWGIDHFMGCLRSFYILYTSKPDAVKSVLKGRHLVFSNKTGVSLIGEIVLSSEDVPSNWLKFLSMVQSYDTVLERLPFMEQKLSELLSNIRIVRRKKRKIMMADEYELLLNRILNSLSRSQRVVENHLHGQDLSHLELVVETESAPLALSSSGQFLIPVSIPASMIVKYISENKEMAYLCLQETRLHAEMESAIVQECIEQLELKDLLKDENLTPQQITKCCERLCDDSIYLQRYIKGRTLRICNYYTVLKDGNICIPWDWGSDIS